jgi:hypothetical protein
LALRFEATNYTESVSVVTVVVGANASLTTKLVPIAANPIVDNSIGGVISVPNSSAQFVLPANAFSAAGTYTVAVTPINPALDSAVMPGDFTTSDGTQFIESFGVFSVVARNAAGQVVDLAAGKTATIRISATSKGGSLTAAISLFYLDKNTGSWVREGTATLVGVEPNQYYEGTVSRFGIWSANEVINTVRFNGCVRDAATGFRVSGVRVISDGINYTSYAAGVTDESGNFSVPMKISSTAVFTGEKDGAFTNSVSKTAVAANFSDTNCLILSSASNSVRIQLTWGQNPSDADSHLITPSGAQIFYANGGNLRAAPFANLDVDDVTSFGPEIITISQLMVGTYTYGVKLFSGSGSLTSSPIAVQLNIAGNLRVFSAPAGETATTRFLRLFTLTVDQTCNITVQSVNTWELDNPTQIQPNATPTYCTAP